MASALYRRYRPESFAEMIGQAHVTEPLMAALRSGKVGHAYLFSGPRGCGKTTSARVLARCLNCAEGPTDNPCGKCPSCVELSRGGAGSIDVVEIDAASHGGVDDARELRERATYAPARDRYKIFIIDEAHMVTSQGFNALLKIVEEPPEYLKFIFATTEPEKVLGTIRSRTHHYPFRLIAPGLLIDYVQQLCDSEGVQTEPGVLPLLVRAGGGSARDTLSILDQLIAGSENGIVTLDRATALLGYTSSEMIDEVVQALAAGDGASLFQSVDRVVQTGQDPRRFTEDLLVRLRDLIVVSATSAGGAAAVFRGVPQDELERLFAQGALFEQPQLTAIAEVVNTALNAMSGATAPRLQLELMMARALTVAEAASGAAKNDAVDPAFAPRRPVSAPAGGTVQRAGQVQHPSQPVTAPQTASVAAQQTAGNEHFAPAPSEPAQQTSSPQSGKTESGLNAAAALAGARAFLQKEMDRITSQPPSTAFLQEQTAEPTPAPEKAQTSGPGLPPQAAAHETVTPATAAAAAPTSAATSATAAQQGGFTVVPVAPQQEEGEPAAVVTPAEQPSAAAPVSAAPAATSAEPTAAPQQPAAAQGTPENSEIELHGAALAELWQEILEELETADQVVFNAVQSITPLQITAGYFIIGLRSKAELENFKQHGATPLREVLFGALGVTLGFKPRRISGSGESSTGAAVPPQPAAVPQGDTVAAAPQLAAAAPPGSTLPTSAWAVPQAPKPVLPEPAAATVAATTAATEITADTAGEQQRQPAGEPQRQPENIESLAVAPLAARQETAAAAATTAAVSTEAQETTAAVVPQLADIERVGESVVRQVFNPRLIGER